jgi:hypothetical protein
MPVVPEDIKNAANLVGSDLVIAYGLSHVDRQHVADHSYSLMGPTGSGKSNVRDRSYIIFRVFTCFKDYRHTCWPTWQTFRQAVGVMHD